MVNIGVLVGSLSNHSYSQKIVKYLKKSQPFINLIQINFDILPLYNPDLEQVPTVEWQVFRNVVDQMDALLIVTPEYNFSIPGGLKNAIDVLSVPLPKTHIEKKPVLVVTDSSGTRGGVVANIHIQQLLRYAGVNVMNELVTIGRVQEVFDRDGELHNVQVASELDRVIRKLADIVEIQP